MSEDEKREATEADLRAQVEDLRDRLKRAESFILYTRPTAAEVAERARKTQWCPPVARV